MARVFSRLGERPAAHQISRHSGRSPSIPTAKRAPDQDPLRHKPRVREAEAKSVGATLVPQATALGVRSLGSLRPEHLQRLQRLVGNRAVSQALPSTIQRLKGAPGTAQAGQPLTIEFSDDFREKHIAEDADGAKKATEKRIKSGGPPGIVKGTTPNHVAKLADWKAVIDAHAAVVPPDGEWSAEDGDIEEPTWVERLAQVTVTGWEPKKASNGDVPTPTPSTFKRYVGGKWQVTGSDFDDEDNLVTPGEAEILIDHLTQ